MVNLAAALAPVVCLLALLVVMDSFKLVPRRMVVQAIVAGVVAAAAALLLHQVLIAAFALAPRTVARFVAPVTEELFKLAFVIYAIRARRVGFPVDAAIVGFAVGTGFAIAENAYYLGVMRSSVR